MLIDMSRRDVTWDEEFQNSLDLHDGLLQQVAWGRQCMDDKLVKWDDDEVLDEIPFAYVIWGEEIEHDLDRDGGLLDHLGQHTCSLSEEEVKSTAELHIDELLHVSGDLLLMYIATDVLGDISLENEIAEKSEQTVFTSSVVWDQEAEEEYEEMPPKSVVWNEEISSDSDTNCEWLQQVVMGAGYSVEKLCSAGERDSHLQEPCENVEISDNLDLHDDLLLQQTWASDGVKNITRR